MAKRRSVTGYEDCGTVDSIGVEGIEGVAVSVRVKSQSDFRLVIGFQRFQLTYAQQEVKS